MCGFFVSNAPDSYLKNKELIRERIKFRGPDYDSGWMKLNSWQGFHVRLSIIGLDSDSNQPMRDKMGGYLLFNGEIFNFKELGQKYFKLEYKSDTKLLSDLIVHEKLVLDELDGFFAFVYFDKLGELKWASRDRFGVKPLYYYENNNTVSFSSEPIALKEAFDLDVDPNALEEYRIFRAPILSQSYIKGVKSVTPGTCYINGTWFEYPFEPGLGDPNSAKLKDAISYGISTRMVSDVKIGLLLSGGIDSNLIRISSGIDDMYSVGFVGDKDESIINAANIKGVKILNITPEQFREDFEYLLTLRGEPLSVPNEVLLFQIAKHARADGVKVLLSGEGADEFFGGYDRIFSWASTQKKFDFDQFISFYCYSKPKKHSRIYNELRDIFESINLNCFEKVRWFFVKFHMPILFRRLDFALMAAGVEGREALANSHIFNVAIQLTSDELMRDGLGKIPLRRLVSQDMGEDFAYSQKIGFPVDMNKIYPEYDSKINPYEIWFDENIKVFQ